MNTIEISEEALAKAAGLVRQSMLDSLPPPSQCTHAFSAAFQGKMARLIARVRRRAALHRAAQRAALFFLAVLVGTGAWLAVDAEARAAFTAWVRDVYESAHVYRFFGEPAAEELPAYRITWLPEGYEQVDVQDDGETFIALYQRDDGESHSFFEFRYFFAQHDRYIGMMTGSSEHKTVDIHGIQADFYQASDPGAVNYLILVDEDAGIVFQIESVLDKSVMVHIAESIVLADTTK